MVKKKKCTYDCIMLIDDSEVDNFINKLMVKGTDFADYIQVYKNGEAALEFFENMLGKEGGEKLLPEIIFLDINMPVMDGFQFIEAFNKLDKKITKDIKIVMLSSSNSSVDRSRSREFANVAGYINKPLTKESLDGVHGIISPSGLQNPHPALKTPKHG